MALPFQSFLIAASLLLLPHLIERAHAGDPARAPSAVAGATYYGDPERRALDGSRRDPSWGASAKDSPTSSYRWREPELPPAPIWGGLYVGVQGGGGVGSFDTGFGGIDGSGALVGAHIGYLARFDAVAAGIEIDADWTGIDDHSAITATAALASELTWLSSARFRLGADVGPLLFYATGGIAIARLAAEASGPGFTISATDTTAGLVLGGGLQVALNERLALRLEALHYRFSEDELVTPAGRFDPSLDVTTVRAGLSLRFN